MKIAVPSESCNGLDSKVCEHFGICPVFTIIELTGGDISSVQVMKNPHKGCGNCLELLEYLVVNDIRYVFADKIGRYPLRMLSSHSIRTMHSCCNHSVQHAVDLFKKNQLMTFPSDKVCSGECEC